MITALEQEHGADLDLVPTLLPSAMAGDSVNSISSSISLVYHDYEDCHLKLI